MYSCAKVSSFECVITEWMRIVPSTPQLQSVTIMIRGADNCFHVLNGLLVWCFFLAEFCSSCINVVVYLFIDVIMSNRS